MFPVCFFGSFVRFVCFTDIAPSLLVGFPGIVRTPFFLEVYIHITNVAESCREVWEIKFLFSCFGAHPDDVCLNFLFVVAFHVAVATGVYGSSIPLWRSSWLISFHPHHFSEITPEVPAGLLVSYIYSLASLYCWRQISEFG